jgi:hypothetical protein
MRRINVAEGFSLPLWKPKGFLYASTPFVGEEYQRKAQFDPLSAKAVYSIPFQN